MTARAHLVGGPNDGVSLPIREHRAHVHGVCLGVDCVWTREWVYERDGETSNYHWLGWRDELDW